MPMIYLPDVIRATVDILKCPNDWLSIRTYNITAMSFTPEEIAEEIKKYIPGLEMEYVPDQLRQNIGELSLLIFGILECHASEILSKVVGSLCRFLANFLTCLPPPPNNVLLL